MDKTLAKQLGRYEILAELGRGAMGIVYKARDPQIDRLVAIKTISLFGQTADDEGDYLTRFFLEARAAGRLTHPGIVTIYDVGECPDTAAPYIVMEYVAGQPLSTLLAASSGKLSMETALQLAKELAEALDYAHSHGVVHRDMKPANVLVTEDGRAKIADFGIAKMNLAQITLPGHVMGTPAFMSPEQLEGGAVDGRSDLFSLGVILYTALTGHRPFQGNSALTVSFKVANRDPVPATAFNSEFPPEIDYLISRAMAKDPALRYQTGREMALDISELLRGSAPRSKGDRLLPNPGSALPTAAIKILRGTKLGPTSDNLVVPNIAALQQKTTHIPHTPDIAVPEKKAAPLRRKGYTEYYIAAALVVVALVSIAAGLHGRRGNVSAPQVTATVSSQPAAPSVPPVLQTVTPDPVAAPASLDDPSLEPLEHAPSPPPMKTSPRARVPKVTKVTPKITPAPIVVSHVETPTPHPVAIADSTLQLQIEHQFTEATLWLWVDNKLVRTQVLQGESKRKLVLFHGVRGRDSGTLQLAAGPHDLRIRVASAEGFDDSGTITTSLAADKATTLRIKCDKGHNKVDLGILP